VAESLALIKEETEFISSYTGTRQDALSFH